jgi:hypothetical protein
LSSNSEGIEQELKKIQILLAGLLLKEEPRPNVESLERFIGVRKGTLSGLFPQRGTRKEKQTTTEDATS